MINKEKGCENMAELFSALATSYKTEFLNHTSSISSISDHVASRYYAEQSKHETFPLSKSYRTLL